MFGFAGRGVGVGGECGKGTPNFTLSVRPCLHPSISARVSPFPAVRVCLSISPGFVHFLLSWRPLQLSCCLYLSLCFSIYPTVPRFSSCTCVPLSPFTVVSFLPGVTIPPPPSAFSLCECHPICLPLTESPYALLRINGTVSFQFGSTEVQSQAPRQPPDGPSPHPTASPYLF